MTWIGFLVSLASILIISRKNLALGLTCGAVILGLFVLPVAEVWNQIILTISDLSIVFLALAMGIIPLIGGTMKDSGQVESLVQNIRIGKRALLALSPALMGLLPMPGGALLSAPLVERGGEGVPNDLKAAINNWFRHLFILVYPLSPALIVSAEISGLDVYRAILFLLPWFAVALLLGYVMFLRRVNGRLQHDSAFSLKGLLIPLAVILAAPILDFSLKRLLAVDTLATLIGVMAGLSLSILFSSTKLDLVSITRRMRPWNFALIILGMFIYLHVFQASDARELIATLPLPLLPLSVTAGFLLGMMTGRVQLPASIILPVYLGTAGVVTPFAFSIIYVAIFFGYVFSPVHPCLVVTCEYFRIPIRAQVRLLIVPTLIIFISAFLLSLVAH